MEVRIPYVGFEPAVDLIPKGTLVRVSLARWWRPHDSPPDMEERCYLQLSGWYEVAAGAKSQRAEWQNATVDDDDLPF